MKQAKKVSKSLPSGTNRTGNTILSEHIPGDVRKEADTVTKKAGFNKPYFVDADHINLDTVDRFIESSDFFTIDVASYIGKKADDDDINSFVAGAKKYSGELENTGDKKTVENI